MRLSNKFYTLEVEIPIEEGKKIVISWKEIPTSKEELFILIRCLQSTYEYLYGEFEA